MQAAASHTLRYAEVEEKLSGMASALGMVSPTITSLPATATSGFPNAYAERGGTLIASDDRMDNFSMGATRVSCSSSWRVPDAPPLIAGGGCMDNLSMEATRPSCSSPWGISGDPLLLLGARVGGIFRGSDSAIWERRNLVGGGKGDGILATRNEYLGPREKERSDNTVLFFEATFLFFFMRCREVREFTRILTENNLW